MKEVYCDLDDIWRKINMFDDVIETNAVIDDTQHKVDQAMDLLMEASAQLTRSQLTLPRVGVGFNRSAAELAGTKRKQR
jgi:hypothetical protein